MGLAVYVFTPTMAGANARTHAHDGFVASTGTMVQAGIKVIQLKRVFAVHLLAFVAAVVYLPNFLRLGRVPIRIAPVVTLVVTEINGVTATPAKASGASFFTGPRQTEVSR